MPAWRAIKWRELVFYLKKVGFQGPYAGGKHQYLVKGELRLTIPNPHQADISLGLLAKILKSAGISRKEWEKL
jgi:predicted RNA binding protein YcfA (HicA-like mRNA interferase family)